MGEALTELIALFDIRQSMADLIQNYGVWTYAILFAVIFAETGLVVAPFLPGDSLLFTAGLFAHPEMGAFNIVLLMGLLMAASFLGDNVNFWVGRAIGRRAFKNEKSKIFKPQYLVKTREFFDKHGTKTIVIGRFVPIVRTYAPFVAGMDAMEYRKFVAASAIGAVTWVSVCVLAGYFFGRIPWVERNFEAVIIGVILLSVSGILVEWAKSRIKKRKARQEAQS